MSEIAESFASSLSELTVNSKPHINMLTMLAEDHLEFAPIITQTVISHLQKVRPEVKLPVLYLIDSIVKNVGKAYINLFTQSIVQNFTNTFEKVDEKTREQMYKLRQTWSDVFPSKTIYALDTKVHQIDPAWPIGAPPSTVHLNPRFFKPDILDSKSLCSSTIKQPDMLQKESRSQHRKHKTYSARSQSVTHSSRSKKNLPTSSSSTESGSKSLPAPELLREQMIMKQKMLLELQQQKLKLELLQTQAQLEEQQKQLEKHAGNQKTSSELSKLQQIVTQEEAKLKIMSKNLKKQVQLKFPKLQQLHRVTNVMKTQKVADLTKKISLVANPPESLVKPAALLELNTDDTNIKPSKAPVVKPPLPKESKSKITQLQQQAMARQKLAPAETTEETPPPVRIAPVSSQLINAALTFGRNVRDPRIRQMSCRLESQLNSVNSAAIAHTSTTPTHPVLSSTVKKVEHPPSEVKSSVKSKKDKKSSTHHHKEKSPKSTEDESKHHSRSSSRSSERSSSKSSGKLEKSPPSKKSEDKNDRKLKVEDLFSTTRSESPITQSPSKSNSKCDKASVTDTVTVTVTDTVEPPKKIASLEKISVKDSSPRRSKLLQDNYPISDSSSGNVDSFKVVVDFIKSQSVKATESNKQREVSPEPLDSSVEMLDEDIEKIVKNPGIVSKLNKFPEAKSKIEESIKSNESAEDKFDDIIKNPTKQVKFDKFSKTSEDVMKTPKPVLLDSQNVEEMNQIESDHIRTKNKNVAFEEPGISASPTATVQKFIQTEENNEKLNVSENLSVSKSSESVCIKDLQDLQQETSKIQRIPKDPRLINNSNINENPPELEKSVPVQEEEKKPAFEPANKLFDQVVSSTVNSIPDIQHHISESVNQDDVVSSGTKVAQPEEHVPESNEKESHSQSAVFGKPVEDFEYTPTQAPYTPEDEISSSSLLTTVKTSETLTLSPKKIQSTVKNVEPMETIQETNENSACVGEFPSMKKSDKKRDSPVHMEKRVCRADKPSIMEQVIADAEKHEASPSPPPPPAVISDKFKEIKQSSLTRLRSVGRSREDLADSESPEPADVDLRTQIQPPTVPNDLKNEVLGLADKDVDLRNLPQSPTKKRPSMEKLLDIPPAKKSKAEVMDELFGSEDVDLRPVLCPPPPSPPPPPIISSSPPPDNAGERLWARYKQTKPDTYKCKYTPSRRDRAPSADKFSRNTRFNSCDGGGRARAYQEDIDMRAQLPGGDHINNHIIMQALEQHKRGDLNADDYKKVLSEVFAMREKRQLEEAQRMDEAQSAQAEHLDSISDEDISGGSLSGVEDAPSPSESYSGAEDIEDLPQKLAVDRKKPELEVKTQDNIKDVDIRLPMADVDTRLNVDYQSRMDVDGKSSEEKLNRKSRGVSPYSRRTSDSEKERYRSRREELRTLRREKKARRSEDDRSSRYRKSRYSEKPWSSREERTVSPTESMDVDAPRVPPLTHYDEGRNYREPPLSVHPPRFDKEFPTEQHDSPPMRPVPWEPPRIPGPGPTPWMSSSIGPPPLIRGGPVMTMPPQDRFMPPRWRQHGPGPIFEGEPTPRFNRFGPPPVGRFPVPLAPCEVPPTDPAVLKLIEEDPTKSINIDGVPRDIRFYGPVAVALMSWDDPREVSFQPGQRRVIIDDRETLTVHFNAPPVEVIIDGKPHRMRFGAPTRELYIDNQWHEVFFGGPLVTCEIAGQPHSIQLEGPPPPVRPGNLRKDLVVGKITLIIDAECLFTVYLDAKPQKFEVKGISYIIRFVEALQKTVINGIAFKSDFGGLPRPIILNGSKHFFRLTALPRGITPGFLTIVNMEGGRLPSPPALPAPPQLPASLEQAVDFKADLKPEQFLQPPITVITAPPVVSPELLNRDVESTTLHPPPTLPPPLTTSPMAIQLPPAVNPLDMLTTLMPAPEPSKTMDYSYSVDNENSNPATVPPADTVTSTATSAPTSTGEINVAELLQKLMATGIVPTRDQAKAKSVDKPVNTETGLIKHVDFRKPETLKGRQTALISHLYSGIQCNSCGVRFPPEQTMKYSQHLDWHFRQNRRDKDSTRTAQSRRYYYDVNDWVQFEEIEDLEERAQPWFDMQDGGLEEEEPPREVVSVRAADYPDEAVCQICHDKFESFYNEEKEEWQLRNAHDNEGKLVHPLCLEDERAAAEKPIVVDDIDITEDEPKEEEVQNKEEEPTKIEDDDDIMEVTDIEFINPVFPVEDLTVSDSESVADNEEKPEIVEEGTVEKMEENIEEKAVAEQEIVEESSEAEVTSTTEIKDDFLADTEKKEESQDEEKSENVELETKDEDTQNDLMFVEKGEDSVLSAAEIFEVVRNIKKDPDALGGEFEDVGLDGEIKKEKGEVPLPAPVVDTTHTIVTCLIDGNVEFEETTQQINVGGPPKIKINITKSNLQAVTKESKETELVELSDADVLEPSSSLTATLSLVNQPPPPGEEPHPKNVKAKIKERKMQEMPPVQKGGEMSGLCSIM